MRAKTGWLALLLAVCVMVLCGCGKTVGNKEESAAVIRETTEPAGEAAKSAGETTESAQETEELTEEAAKPTESTKPAETEKTEAEAAEKVAEETPAEEPETVGESLLVTEAPEETEPAVEELMIEEPANDESEHPQTIEITVPAGYADARYRIGEVTGNPDDSVTYRLTEEEHIRLLAEVHSDIQQELDEMCASSYFLDFFSIKANEDCTGFTVVCLSIETTMAEQESIPQLYEYGKKFAAYEGREPGNIHIDYMTKIGNTFVMRDSERDERQVSAR